MRYTHCAMTSCYLHSGLGIQHINAASPHASPLRRLGLSPRNRVRNASYSSTGGSSLEPKDCSYPPPPSSSSDMVITHRPRGDSPRTSGSPSSSPSNNRYCFSKGQGGGGGKAHPLLELDAESLPLLLLLRLQLLSLSFFSSFFTPFFLSSALAVSTQ